MPHSPRVVAPPAGSVCNSTHAPHSPPEAISMKSPSTRTLSCDSQDSVGSRDSKELLEVKDSRSPHPLSTLPPDAAESAVQSLASHVPPSSPAGHEPIFEDITEASNLSAPENSVDVTAGNNGNGSAKASRAVISQEETLNAVAGLLACYDDYSEDASVQPTDEETLMPPDASVAAEDAFEEAQKAAQMLQCEMPGERDDAWPQQTPHSTPTASTKVSGESETQPVPTQEEEEEEEPDNVESRFPQAPPDSPASMQSEPELQIDEDQPDPVDDMEGPPAPPEQKESCPSGHDTTWTESVEKTSKPQETSANKHHSDNFSTSLYKCTKYFAKHLDCSANLYYCYHPFICGFTNNVTFSSFLRSYATIDIKNYYSIYPLIYSIYPLISCYNNN
ncbi:hypothetical protein C7M84_009031 [Penaeus vannamei]|uniref:Uncharacterized protein n=1 Tax=Penaeus vannamei TaxID=6689 RepID=A0A3R7P158_PENVA|nr:hypothetical protein C7M84_019489 [Penaeus vannamei]ROT72574.1 hypothetical protein C7M84_009031 [Penaeus vannamei]